MALATDLESPWTQQPDPYSPRPSAGTTADGWPTNASVGLPQTPAATSQAPPSPSPTPSAASGATPAASYLTDLNGAGTPPGGGAPASSVQSVTDYSSHLGAIASATDPQSSAVAKDTLARRLQSDLTADGHDVAWKGETLLIDGRPYELGGGAPSPVTASSTVGPARPGQDPPRPDPTPTPAAPPTSSVSPPATTSGPAVTPPLDKIRNAVLEFARTHPGANPSVSRDPEYWARQILGTHPNGNVDWAYWSQRMLTPEGPAEGGGRAGTTGSGPLTEQQVLDQTNHYARIAWGRDLTPDDLAQMKRDLGYQPGAPIDPKMTSAIEAWVMNHRPKTGGATGTGGGGATQLPPGFGDWQPGAPYYLPTFVDQTNDIPDFKSVYDKLSAPQPGDVETEALVKQILAHPESLTDQEIASLKAKNAEELAVGAQAQDEELQHFGYQSGLENSPWLAAQRAGRAWDRRSATVAGNRNIDLTAASTRQADRQKAAQLGSAYSSYRSTRQQSAVNMAVESAVARAGESRNRSSMNETLKQAATSLGMSRDQLTLTYMKTNLDYLTTNKAIDNTFSVNIKQLQQQSDQFRETLLQRIAELKQQDEQFRANYGLDLQRLESLKNNDAWERARTLYGL